MKFLSCSGSSNCSLLCFFILLCLSLFRLSETQQPYIDNMQLACYENNNLNSTNGYVCNGPQPSCLSYLTFRSTPPYDSALIISYLFGSDPSVISRINYITTDETIPTDTLVIVPVNCSCAGGLFYQHNTSYYVQSRSDTYFTLANNTYQGLTTCQALMNQNHYDSQNLSIGQQLLVPLRCACPSTNQSVSGVKYLLEHLVTWGDTISALSATYNVTEESLLNANELNESSLIYPFTPLLVPLKSEPAQKIRTSNLQPTAAPQSRSTPRPIRPTGNAWKKITAAAIIAGAFVIVVVIVTSCYLRRKTNSIWKGKTKNARNVEAFLQDCGLLALKRYNYKDVKKMTNSFKDKIGQGGYGSVFKGRLPDGNMVAVKILSETKGDGKEFMNEVASISRTSHVNIVTLLGFCVHGLKRALIYEFMPNGSLEKFIHSDTVLNTHLNLGWKTLYKIVIGIARGLEYLHRGCNTRILHFDIKPHNILLDADFTPKIADFGLSKLSHVKESIISMTGARGTPGYIAPEMIYRNFGGVSHKSDVYSYGMLVLEMAGGTRKTDTRTTDASEMYFPHWIYKRLDLNEDMELHGITSLEDTEFAKKLILVGLWCIQIDPQSRPPMSIVLEMLEGSLEALQIPPRPYLSSPSTQGGSLSSISTL